MDAHRTATDGRSAFDFLIGTWIISAKRLCPDQAWEPVTGTTRVIPILQGTGNIDDDEFRLTGGVHVGGMLRLFDAEANVWLTYGLDRDRGYLQPPLSGRFHDGCGMFHGEDVRDGRSILVRHIYLDLTPTSCRWEQAFSSDGGHEWKTNWEIDFTRVDMAGTRT